MRRLEAIPSPRRPLIPPPWPAGPRQQRPPHPTKRAPMEELKPYQLESKIEKPFLEPPIEEPEMLKPPLARAIGPPDPKKLKRMKKKLNELNRKTRHSKKRHDGLVHKGNELRKAIEGLKRGITKLPATIEQPFVFVECEQAFDRAYRSYRVMPGFQSETNFSL